MTIRSISARHPWALLAYGFRAIVAPSFADIFGNNCHQNGILPVVLAEAAVAELIRRAEARPGYRLTVDREACEVRDEGGVSLPFAVDAFRRHCLLHGLDDIGLTLQHEQKIEAYERRSAT